ncbi:hypothetical protein KTS45_12845 [Halomicroarcula limicola]|uniref:Fenitrothion hydrolase n=1 Tax=Haloarcula limicola TaxID=1429915 RepID=A0A8J7YC01_9EURY|nr:hypothetical protein [Halomicroarcula limicola]MBV0925084.1 hypothetical protein [Halomicroarcula limicola]
MRGRSRRSPLVAPTATVLAVLAFSGVASAHGAVGGGIEAPIPLWLLYAGAGGTVAVTAGWLAVGERTGGLSADAPSLSVPFWLSQALGNVGRALGLAALLAVLLSGVLGQQIQSENVATVLFWPVWLKGLGLVAVVAGSPWRVLSPWRTIYLGLARLEGEPPAVLGAYPERLGDWPAVVGFALVVGITENLTLLPRSPRLTAALVAGYALIMLVGALAYGPTWLRRADALAVLYRLLGRVAPLAVAREGGGYRLSLRAPWRACTRPVTDTSTAAFVVLALYTVSFDGLTNTRAFRSLLASMPTDLGPTPAAVVLYLAGFALFLGSYRVAVAPVGRLGDGDPGTHTAIDGPATVFAASLLPIAAAYEVAHTYPFVLRNLGVLAALLTDGIIAPDPVAGLPLSVFWGSQVGLVVAGHLVAVVAAHAVAVEAYGRRGGRRAHAPLVAVMVGYTVLSLWIISQPVVN